MESDKFSDNHQKLRGLICRKTTITPISFVCFPGDLKNYFLDYIQLECLRILSKTNDDVFLFLFFFNMSMFALYVQFIVNFLIRLPCILMRRLTGVSSSYHRC